MDRFSLENLGVVDQLRYAMAMCRIPIRAIARELAEGLVRNYESKLPSAAA